MTEAAILRKLRSANAKLMKTNLTLLLTDRESDVEMQELTEQLKECARQMEARGIAMPPKYALLLQGEGAAGLQKVDESRAIEQHNPEQSDGGRSAIPDIAAVAVAEDSSTPAASSVAENGSVAVDHSTPAVPRPEDRDDSDSSDDDSSSDDDLE